MSHQRSAASPQPWRAANVVCRGTLRGLALTAILIAGVSCSDDSDRANNQAQLPLVVCSTGMIADLAREIGGPDVRVVQLVRAGVDPHLYSPTRDDVQRLATADLILYNGLLLEGRMGDALQRLAKGGKTVVAVAESLPPERLMADPDQGGQADPHVWMDVALWTEVAAIIGDHIMVLVPDAADDIARRREKLIERLEQLDQSIHNLVATVPGDRRVLVTAHDAFGYFGRAYGVEVRGIQGFSTESEAGLRDINELVDFLIERGIGAVFVESTVSDRNVRALVEGTRSRGHDLVVGGELFSDSTGPEGTHEGTYIGMMEHNARTVVSALGGIVSETVRQN